MRKKSKYQKLQDGEWKSSLRTGSLSDKPRRITSDYHMARVAARKLRRSGAKKEANEMFARAEMMKLAGHPTVKSQAFVDAEQYAMAKGGIGSSAQDAYGEFLRNRNKKRPRINMDEPPTSYQGGGPSGPYEEMPAERGPYRGPYTGRYGNGPEEIPLYRRGPEMGRADRLNSRMDRTSTR